MSSYPALHGRTSGVAEIQQTRIIFVSDSDGSEIIIPTSTLRIHLEGKNSHHYYLTDGLRPDSSICIQSPLAIKELAQFRVPAAVAILDQAKKKTLKRTAIVGSPFAISIALILFIPLFLAFLPASWLSKVLTSDQEKAMGQWRFPMIKMQYSLSDTHASRPHIQKLLEYIRSSNPSLQKMDFDIYVSNSQDVNAFAAPGNIIVVNEGLIDKAESIEEVAGVLAHELGHLEQKHVLKSLAGGMGSLFGTLLLGSFIGYDAALLVSNASDFVSLKYSRDDELAADRQGFIFLQNSKVSTQGMISFFDKLSEIETIPPLMSVASTHPASKDRVVALKALLLQYPEPISAPIPVSLNQLKTSN